MSVFDGHVDVWDGVDWMSTAVRCFSGCGGRGVKLRLDDEFEGIGLLGHVDRNVVLIVSRTFKINS